MPQIITNLWFDTEAHEAAEYYCSIFPGSEITRVAHYTDAGPGPAGSVVTVDFLLDGKPFTAINGGPQFPFTEAISMSVSVDGQAEVDRLWERLTDGGEPSMCAWLKDQFGLSWQIVPSRLLELLADPDPGRAGRAMEAMLRMSKIDIATLEAAADGDAGA